MKIIAKTSTGYLVEATADEIAQCAGFPSAYRLDEKYRVSDYRNLPIGLRVDVESTFDGVLMAYRDCAEIADRIAAGQPGFVAYAVKAGQSKADAEIAAMSGMTIALQFAASIRSKIDAVEVMIANAPPPPRRGHAGGVASAANMTPEQRHERAKKAALARWKGVDNAKSAV